MIMEAPIMKTRKTHLASMLRYIGQNSKIMAASVTIPKGIA
jgi:hypothetical protein